MQANTVGGGVTIRFYDTTTFGAVLDPSPPGYEGIHPIVPGAIPSWVIAYLPLAAAGDHQGGVRAITAGPNGNEEINDYVTLSANTWRKTRTVNGVMLEVEDCISTFLYEGGIWKRIDGSETKHAGILYAKKMQTHGYLYNPVGPDTHLFLLEETIFDSVGSSLTTSRVPDSANFGRVKSVQHPDGSWEAYQYYTGTETSATGDPYDAQPGWSGELKETLKPWNGLPTTPASATAANSERTVVQYGIGPSQGLEPLERKTTRPGPGGPVVCGIWTRTAGGASLTDLLSEAGLASAWIPAMYTAAHQDL